MLLLLAGLALQRSRRRASTFKALLELSPNGLLILDGRHRIRWHNPSARRLLEQSAQQLRADLPISRWLPALTAMPAPLERIELQLPTSQGLRQQDLTRLPDIDGQTVLLLHPETDLQSSAETMERFKRSQYFAQIGTWDWEIDTDRLYWSEAIYGMFGYQPGAVTPSYSLFCNSVHPDDRERVRAGEIRCIETGENHDEEYRVVWPDGSVHWVRETGNVIKNEQGEAIRMMGVVRDITDEKRSAQELRQLAHKDPLTGLPNRLMLEQQLGAAITRARAQNSRLALVFIDLNKFKFINDQHGHAAGDTVLVEVAQRLRSAVRSSDMVARLGGDEFVVLLEGLSRSTEVGAEAERISAKLLTSLAPAMTLQGRDYRIGASLGVALFPEHAPTMDKLIHAADLAMYAAKRSGNNQYRLGEDLNTHTQALSSVKH
ncbi:diguanylate cyclase domain-containing protein [Halopseudomonas maritima]|uniref:diguanylate cyclase domain-containing protein n=1 Tax=Halopseudomonas maritima TaxID=2918528 RepID=UPI001EEB46FC|nr:diguanylate cyclase [Halopseudomonas maritima]UJJ30718.1 diguanylate cyclase [Halopseudomonas maritima]